MSSDLYPTRLYWDGRRGLAKHDGVSVVLTEAPHVLPDVAEIDYAPGIDAEIRPHPYDKMRDMEAPEIAIVRGWLERLAKSVHRIIARKPKSEPK